MKSLLSLVCGVLIFGSLIGCSPRGESKTLDQVLALQKEKFDSASKSATPDTLSLVNNLGTQLERLGQGSIGQGNIEQSSATPAKLEELANSLSLATDKAGYTSRPAMTELVAQYRALSLEKHVESNALRLLLARTYSILSSELETTRFSL